MTSHENTLKQALMGLSKLQLPILNDISKKEIKEIQQAENAENKINNLTDEQKNEFGTIRLTSPHNGWFTLILAFSDFSVHNLVYKNHLFLIISNN